ncbi:hypothetical protein PHYBLDRAFT_161375 [Phycomyces blakesleeanus NRRL 1555(-)]|uniref:Uncharacterized protein n=1 Tax=Phycomyces blakesleeanus (strain ATCC 8743b / DSM 1359 / FGSC 10004 / NBRC 33097 / NRRL 1555) TaxID=763407 RepID=A0A167R359_PHYB8|nr:hypothetical protein PHYBLDRAFT_161375 [Phycomyces blakesleeanus NRRL 1555(-)]OAD80737.1 hypothetical protein PHYBLDRAFT_161375 [Phycomyces blakesleeanus NRRL 1555(-)]|eukprot:XP_018298777.1 hypothetical protein PHYBLDRAFT_161375 [Phycomyces blakesleeanus NRRL 1555(-)]
MIYEIEIEINKCLNASAAASQLGIHILAEQIWVKHYYEVPESIFEKNQGDIVFLGMSILSVICLLSKHSFILWKGTVRKSLSKDTTGFKSGSKLTWISQQIMFFLDESAFHINLKRDMTWSKKGTPAVVTVPITKAKATSILGAISSRGLINVSLRVSKRIKKINLGCETNSYSIGTVIKY